MTLKQYFSIHQQKQLRTQKKQKKATKKKQCLWQVVALNQRYQPEKKSASEKIKIRLMDNLWMEINLQQTKQSKPQMPQEQLIKWYIHLQLCFDNGLSDYQQAIGSVINIISIRLGSHSKPRYQLTWAGDQNVINTSG